MPVLVVDRYGNVLPATAIVFGQGYNVEDLGFGVARVAASGDVTRESTVERPVTRWAMTVTRWITAEATAERTVTRAVTRPREITRVRYLDEVTVTRDASTVTRDRFDRTATKDVSVTAAVTHDKFAATVTLPVTAVREITVTRHQYVTRFA